MTRKHYEAIAQVFTQYTQREEDRKIAEHIARNMCAYFQADNPKFQKQRFLEACGIEKSQT